MSAKYFYKKAISSVYNANAGFLKTAVIGAATIIAPVYIAGEMVLNDPSDVRTPVVGDEQEAALEKNLSNLMTFTRNAQGKMAELNALRQQSANDSANAVLAGQLRAMEERQIQTARDLEGAKRGFTYGLLMSEGISEVDAKSLLNRYEDVFGEPELYISRGGGTPGNFRHHALSYLDECQKDALSGNVYQTAGTANQIDMCMYKRADEHALGALMAGLFGGLPFGIASLIVLSLLGNKYGRDIVREEQDRKRTREKEKRDKIKTDEVSLKIKIEKPNL